MSGPEVSQQFAFGEDGLEPSEENVETSLEHFGAEVDHRERTSRQDQPAASTFGVDDRPTVTRTDSGDQGALFADTAADQRTLTGERASARCLWRSHERDGSTMSTGGD